MAVSRVVVPTPAVQAAAGERQAEARERALAHADARRPGSFTQFAVTGRCLGWAVSDRAPAVYHTRDLHARARARRAGTCTLCTEARALLYSTWTMYIDHIATVGTIHEAVVAVAATAASSSSLVCRR